MKNRGVVAVVLLSIVTLGIYSLYWLVSTKRELNTKGANIPTSWLLIIPLVNYYWLYKYYEGAEQVTNKKVNGLLMFLLNIFVTGLIPYAMCQDVYNNMSEGPVLASSVPLPNDSVSVESAQPTQSVQETTFSPNNPTNPQPATQFSTPPTLDTTIATDIPAEPVLPTEEIPPTDKPTV